MSFRIFTTLLSVLFLAAPAFAESEKLGEKDEARFSLRTKANTKTNVKAKDIAPLLDPKRSKQTHSVPGISPNGYGPNIPTMYGPLSIGTKYGISKEEFKKRLLARFGTSNKSKEDLSSNTKEKK